MSEKSLTVYLQEKKNRGEKLFIPYIVAGGNGLERLEDEINTLAENGATAIELGIPFSDPVADGPIIQKAAQEAFKHQVTFKKIVQFLRNMQAPVPIILMGYANSFFHYGFEKLLADLASTDVKGLIIPDVPYEHRELILHPLAKTDIALIQLVTLTSTKERMQTLVNVGEGFIYAVTVNGTTGIGQTYRDSLNEHLAFITEISSIPVLAGFGVSNREQVARFNQVCDGVIVGSKLVASLAEDGVEATGKLVAELTDQ
ncbi:tryptophan synthase subunit alpha [Enterococcus sp. LJL98]